MDKFPPSIFNDVIGPVMRGPSSSHVAGAARIASLVRQSMECNVVKVVCDFDVNGSLAESHDGHGTDMGFICGLLGKEITDPDVADYWNLAKEAGLEVKFRVLDYGAAHPNFYRIEARASDSSVHRWDAISTGGGMIEMVSVDGFKVSIAGDFYELLLFADGAETDAQNFDKAHIAGADYTNIAANAGRCLIEHKFSSRPDERLITSMRNALGNENVVVLNPVLPTLSSADCSVPFVSAEGLLEYQGRGHLEMWELAALYESKRGGKSGKDVLEEMVKIVDIMQNSVKVGLEGTDYKDRILGRQSDRIDAAAARLVPDGLLNKVMKYITAIMEVKSSMGVIVAAPTAGSCGCLPGTILAAADAMGLPKEKAAKAMLAAGLIGVFIAKAATFAAEVAGCQVECGAGSAMAAAGITQLMGGTPEECVSAAAFALQNITGLACDPVANRVEVPCLGKNLMGGANAIISANMALAGFKNVIPLDQTIAAIYDIGLKLPLELRCTCGGLGKTEASAQIRHSLCGNCSK